MAIIKSVELEQVCVGGELGDRLERSASHLLSWIGTKSFPSLEQDPANYAWGADFQGRWLDAVSRLARCVDVQKDELDRMAAVILDWQKPCGSFNPGKTFPTMFGDARGLIGLVEYFCLSGDEKYLEAAKRLADRYPQVCREVYPDTSKTPETFWASTVIEGLVRLWEQCKEDKYLRMAKDRIEAVKDQLSGPYSQGPMPDHGHSHSYLNSVHGILRYCVAISDLDTDKQAYMEPVIELWDALASNAMWMSGGIPELLPNSIECDEPCSTGDWLGISLWLWKLTGQVKYLDMAERSLLNHLYFNQLPSGGFSSTSNIEQGFRGLEAWWCCSMHGARSLCEAAQHIYGYDQDNIWVNLFMPSRVKIDVQQSKRVEIELETQYPRDGTVTIHVNPADEATFNLKVRVPSWIDSTAVTAQLNGDKANVRIDNGLLVISRKWSRGDKVSIGFPMPMRVETDVLGHHEHGGLPVEVDAHTTNAKRIAVFWGPLLLAVFRTGHGNDLVWVYRDGYNEILDSGGMQGTERSCPEYLRIDEKSFNVNRNADFKGFGVARSSVTTRVVIESECVRLQWQRPLADGSDDIGNIECSVQVFAGLPVKLQYDERVSINASQENPRTVTQAMLSGVRFSTNQEQYHDTYYQIWRYEYPPVQVSDSVGPFSVPQDADELKNTGSYCMDNGVFRAECEYSGDVERIVVVRKDDWTGVYLSPIREQVTLRAATVFTIKKILAFPFSDYGQSHYMPKEWTDELMTQPILTVV